MAQTTTMAPISRTTLHPLHDRVLVQRLAGPDEHGRIVIPDTAKEKPQDGRVIAVGAGRIGDDGTRIPMEVKQGDRILFARYSGAEVTLDGSEYLVMKEEDVLGILV
jgi:chaperonin GroES